MKEYSLDYFLERRWSFVLISGGRVFYKSKKDGLKPLIFCVKRYKKNMRGAIVFDKVIGRAAALLLIYGGVKKVMTPLASRSALNLLRKNKIRIEYKNLVPHILNKKGDDICPMEKMSGRMKKEDFLIKFGIRQ